MQMNRLGKSLVANRVVSDNILIQDLYQGWVLMIFVNSSLNFMLSLMASETGRLQLIYKIRYLVVVAWVAIRN